MLIAPPESWEGSLSAYVDRYVLVNCPPPERLTAWAEALLAYYVDGNNPVCIVRDARNRGVVRRQFGLRVVGSDNAPGIWAYLRCQDGSIRASDLTAILETGRLPVLMALARDARERWTYGGAMRSPDKKQLWGRRLKHCHIFPAGGASAHLSPRQLAIRNLCPLNHFLFPTPKAFQMARIDSARASEPSDLGESATAIAWVLHRLRQYLGTQSRVLERFVLAAGGKLVDGTPSDATIRIVRKVHSPQHGGMPSSDPPAELGVTRAQSVGRRCRWTLNAAQGYYVRTGLKEQFLALELSYKDPSGTVHPVGSFHLDLPALARSGAVTRRSGSGVDVFDVRIVRDAAGSYWLSIQSAVRVRLT